MAISNLERETIISFNDHEKEATVYTMNKSLKSNLEKYSSDNPEFKLVKSDEESATYSIPKKYIKIKQPKKLTEEQRNSLRERLALARTKKYSSP